LAWEQAVYSKECLPRWPALIMSRLFSLAMSRRPGVKKIKYWLVFISRCSGMRCPTLTALNLNLHSSLESRHRLQGGTPSCTHLTFDFLQWTHAFCGLTSTGVEGLMLPSPLIVILSSSPKLSSRCPKFLLAICNSLLFCKESPGERGD
jgi:hypothetical protein